MILDKNTESKSITKGENQKNPEHLDIDRREIKKSDLIKIKKHDAYKSPVTPDEFQNNTKKNGNTIKFGQFHKYIQDIRKQMKEKKDEINNTLRILNKFCNNSSFFVLLLSILKLYIQIEA